jgi:hypothetical protein
MKADGEAQVLFRAYTKTRSRKRRAALRGNSCGRTGAKYLTTVKLPAESKAKRHLLG